MPRTTVKRGSSEAAVLRSIYEEAECRVAVLVGWADLRDRLVGGGLLATDEANQALKALKGAGYVLTGEEAGVFCNGVRGAAMDICITETGQAALGSI